MLRLRPNPGGQLSIDEIIGRDALIGQTWQVLERQSLVLTAERRMGKTMLLKKAGAAAPHGASFVYHDLESIRTAEEFADAVYRDVAPRLPTSQKVVETLRRVAEHVEGIEVAGQGVSLRVARSPWEDLLENSLARLGNDPDQPFVFFWDEMPLMVDNIAKQDGPACAIKVLDTLRSLRHTYAGLRMVYTGSIGLHHVIAQLRQAGYANDPTNDMYHIEVPPLLSKDATLLARALLAGAEIEASDPEAVAEAMATAVDNIPYYVHYLASALQERGPATVGTVSEVVTEAIVASNDPWHLQHYEERVDTYYQAADRPLILALLDTLAGAQHPLPFAEVFNLVKSQVATEDHERVRRLLDLLCQDHYLRRNEDGAFVFRYSVIRRWWCLHRGVGERP